MLPLTVIMTVEEALLTNNVENFFRKSFETYQILISFTVMIRTEKKFKKIFETTHSLIGFTAMMRLEKQIK